MSSLLTFLTPWEFSPTVLLATLASLLLYWRGLRVARRLGRAVGVWPRLSFVVGVLITYLVMQTYIDYLSQHMFWIHRAQHLVLHHLGPFLVMLANPFPVLGLGLPSRWQPPLLALWQSRPVRTVYLFLQNPIVAPLLFVGLIAVWLSPGLHFEAMLSETRYKVMNWSVLIDGFLFWWLILDPRTPYEHRTLRYPVRVLILWVVMVLQIIIGAVIGLSRTVLYDVYNVCGRAWPISPLTDQSMGGLTTWIPASMMSVIAIILVARMWMRHEKQSQ